jgi:peroxiredoxin
MRAWVTKELSAGADGMEERMINVGEQAPGFSVNDHQGNVVSLATLRGRSVVLWFYPEADTPG